MFHRGSVGALRFNSAPALAGVQAIAPAAGPVGPAIVTDPASGATAAKAAFPLEHKNWGLEGVFRAEPGSVLRAPSYSRILPWALPDEHDDYVRFSGTYYLRNNSTLIPLYRDGGNTYWAVEYTFPEGGVWVYEQWAVLPPAIVPYWVTGTPRRIA